MSVRLEHSQVVTFMESFFQLDFMHDKINPFVLSVFLAKNSKGKMHLSDGNGGVSAASDCGCQPWF